jgi:hypothetical protein
MISELRRDTVKLGNLLSIAEQIQAFGSARKTGEIYVTNVAPPARINMVEGEIVDAQFGLTSGLPAAISLINLHDPHTEFIVGEKPPSKTIDMPYMQVLCEAARLKDELAQQETQRLVEPDRLAPGNPSLRVTLGMQIMIFPIRPGITSIGRSTLNDVVINDATISQRHASIEYSRTGVLLKDLGSTNGTRVGGETVKERWLEVEEKVQFGAVPGVFAGGIKKASS